MKTLVIHPRDYSTDFLARIYEDTDWTVITKSPGKRLLKQAILDHDRIIMMGHGCDKGLFDGDFNTVIDSNFVYLLREKTCVGVWCNADKFFEKYELQGLYTGMIISENDEAYLFGIEHVYGDIDNSNVAFAMSMKTAIQESLDGQYNAGYIISEYEDRAQNYIVDFNKERIFFR